MGTVILFPIDKVRRRPPAAPLSRGSVRAATPGCAFIPWRAAALGMEIWMEWLKFWTLGQRPKRDPRRLPENVVSIAAAKARPLAGTGCGC
jgi:hypothetical protein